MKNKFAIIWKVALVVAVILMYKALPISIHRPESVFWVVGIPAILFVAYIAWNYSRKIAEGAMTESQAFDDLFERIMRGKN